MPKKPPKNAFFFYMMFFKKEQAKRGKNLPLSEVADAASESWNVIQM